MQSIAQGWLLFELTSSPFYLGLFSSLRMVLLLCFFVLGGLMSDRWERRKVMLWIQAISALTALGLAFLVVENHPGLAYFCARRDHIHDVGI